MKISLIINTRNEFLNLAACIESVGDLCDEIVIVDMQSEDRTLEIARRYTDLIYTFENVGYVEPARNYAISKATGEWLIILDADERMTPELAEKLRTIAFRDDEDVVIIHWCNIFFGHEIRFGGWENDKHARFFRKGSVTFPESVHAAPEIIGRVTELPDIPSLQITHYNYDSISQFVQKLNSYTTAEVGKLVNREVRFSWFRALLQTLETFRWRYLRRRGFRHGDIGLVVCLLMSVYTLVTWLKLWEHHQAQSKQTRASGV
ncbi:MAG: glycosyltransferase family 2 protein [Candidatus Latescibacteria bacterium]|nr:glycosyltransferase family 2 protein [Candidatus Latescibacterota bacterium]